MLSLCHESTQFSLESAWFYFELAQFYFESARSQTYRNYFLFHEYSRFVLEMCRFICVSKLCAYAKIYQSRFFYSMSRLKCLNLSFFIWITSKLNLSCPQYFQIILASSNFIFFIMSHPNLCEFDLLSTLTWHLEKIFLWIISSLWAHEKSYIFFWNIWLVP